MIAFQDDGYSFLREVSRSFQSRPVTSALWTFGILLAAVLAVILLHWWASTRRTSSRARRMFHDLADANELTAAERRLLLRIAQAAQPEKPHLLFVQRTKFDKGAVQLQIGLGPASALRKKLYETL
jgi:hypothetical protein